MPRYDPLPYQRPFTHGWDGNPDTSNKNIGRCRICNYGPGTPRNLGYHYLDTHDLTVEQAAAAVAGLPMPALDQDGGVEMGVDEDDSPV